MGLEGKTLVSIVLVGLSIVTNNHHRMMVTPSFTSSTILLIPTALSKLDLVCLPGGIMQTLIPERSEALVAVSSG